MTNLIEAAKPLITTSADGVRRIDAYSLSVQIGMRPDVLMRKVDDIVRDPFSDRAILDDAICAQFVDLGGRKHRSYLLGPIALDAVSQMFHGRYSVPISRALNSLSEQLHEDPYDEVHVRRSNIVALPPAAALPAPLPASPGLPAVRYSISDAIRLLDRWELSPASEQVFVGRLLGVDLPAPVVNGTYKTATDFERESGIPKSVVGRLLKAVRQDPANGEYRMNAVPLGTSGQYRDTPSYYYNERGQRLAEPILRDRLAQQ